MSRRGLSTRNRRQRNPIAFYSRIMTVADKNYDTSQKELLATVKAVEHFKQFLYGKEFVIKTDHQPLTSIKTKAKPFRTKNLPESKK